MRTVIIYNDQDALNEITYYLRKHGAEILGAFSASKEGFECVITKRPDVVFLNIEPPVLNGIELGMQIRKNHPKIDIVYLTPHPQFALESFKAYPLDYILMPIDENRLVTTMEYIRSSLKYEQRELTSAPRIKCFGKFEVGIDNKNVRFATQKVRELLAFLLCYYKKPFYRGDMIGSLFRSGDVKKDATNFRVTLFRLRHTFKDAGVKKEHLLINENCSIMVAAGICDLIDFFEFIQKNKVINDSNILKAQHIIDTIEGELFSDIDALWIADIREFISVQIETLMLNTAQFYLESGKNLESAEHILTKLLEINDLSENGYTMLLDIYVRASNTEKYIYLFKRYAKVMKMEFNSVPDKKYVRHYVNMNQ